MENELEVLSSPKIRGRGRPPKADIEAVKNRTKNKIGRPKGDTGRLEEFKQRLLATGGTRILDKMISIALDDNHPGQMAAIKMSIDRMLPVSSFEAAKNGGQSPTISINITGLNSSVEMVDQEENIVDV